MMMTMLEEEQGEKKKNKRIMNKKMNWKLQSWKVLIYQEWLMRFETEIWEMKLRYERDRHILKKFLFY